MDGDRLDNSAIVLIHGVHDFRFMRYLWPGYRYFRKLQPVFAGSGPAAYFPTLPNGGRLRERAEALAAFLQEVPQAELHLVAHSMGGLDARYVVSNLDPEARIRSLTTIATPHRGTAAAVWAQQDRCLEAWLARRLMLPGLRDLTPEACAGFNARTPDRVDVRYRSYAGARPTRELPLKLRRAGRVLQSAEGDNDGVVSTASASWGEFQPMLRADHVELIGWSLSAPDRGIGRPFDHAGLYRSILSSILHGGSEPESCSPMHGGEIGGGDK
jgi:triacylglycerol lipase